MEKQLHGSMRFYVREVTYLYAEERIEQAITQRVDNILSKGDLSKWLTPLIALTDAYSRLFKKKVQEVMI